MSDDSRRFYEDLGMNIKVARVRRKMRQCDLARAVGVGAVTVCRWESGDRRIPVHDLLKVCQALDQPIGVLMPEWED
jgi:transcriptional regulator with XRE-family HTH domain